MKFRKILSNPEFVMQHTETELETNVDNCFLVRLGTMGNVGRFRSTDPIRLKRSKRVVCRTARGIEVGLILGPAGGMVTSGAQPSDLADGRILRIMAPEDELLWAHLQEMGNAARQSCENWLRESGSIAILLDVEPLLDGRTLVFHFLREVEPELQSQLDRLVAIYEAEVRSSQFAQLLEHGCGPGCGTDKAERGCGSSGGCAVCKVASSCKK